jgi:hypothetical protein
MLQAIPMLSETPFFFLVLWMEPRALHRPGKRPAIRATAPALLFHILLLRRGLANFALPRLA